MNDQAWTQVRVLFERVLDLAPTERADALAAERARAPEIVDEVERLLAVDARLTASTDPLARDAAAVLQGRLLAPGVRIDGFEIVRVLGAGGMGTVYEARQESPRRSVALKTLMTGRVSARARQRFAFEAEVLGRLRHPCIAQIFAAGAYDDPHSGATVPWFALELLDGGMALTEFARAHDLDLRARIRMFLRVCDAVQHGHTRGVVHRDLKPANILVDGEGRPKVIDFGIARCAEEGASLHTADGLLLGTPLYMSPEQLRGENDDIDARSDVYSLGVVLYELLVDAPPFDVDGQPITAVVRAVLERQPTPPSQRAPGIPRELDWIVARAMAAVRAERYPTVAALADDLQRFLGGEALVAGPTTFLYRVRKLLGRHRVAAAAVVVSLAGLLAFSILATLLMVRARRAEKIATERAVELHREVELQRDVSAHLRDVLAALRAGDVANSDRALAVLDRAAAGVEELYRERIDHGIALLTELGRTARELGRLDRAATSLEPAVELARQHLSPVARDRLAAEEELASLLALTGDTDRAEDLLRTALTARVASSDSSPAELATTRAKLGHVLLRKGDAVAAETLFADAHATFAAGPAADRGEALATLSGLVLAVHARRDGRARALAEQALALADAGFGRHSAKAFTARNNLATVLIDTGEPALALPLLEEIVADGTELFGAESDRVRTAVQNLGATCFRLGKLEDAERWMRRGLEIPQPVTPQTVVGWINLVVLLGQLERWDDALAAADRIDAELSRLLTGGFAKDHALHGVARLVRGRALTGARRFEAAEPILLDALARLRTADPSRVPKVHTALVELYDAWGRPDAAAPFRATTDR